MHWLSDEDVMTNMCEGAFHHHYYRNQLLYFCRMRLQQASLIPLGCDLFGMSFNQQSI